LTGGAMLFTKRFAEIKLIVFDFDGVMTDNRVILSESGEESVAVNRADGWGIRMLREKGYPMVILSTEKNKVVTMRARKLDIPVLQGIEDKATILADYCRQQKIDLQHVLYIGNDVNDYAAMQLVGVRVVPANGHKTVKAIADIVLETSGGGGVVRELADMICNEEASFVRNDIIDAIRESARSLEQLAAADQLIEQISRVTEEIIAAFKRGNRVYLFGNGGSAADAQHIAAEFIGKFKKERQALPAEALTVNTSVLTALANDYDYSLVFVRQIEGHGQPGDICIGLSTSGNARNVLLGMEAAVKKGMQTVAITGATGGKLKNAAGICLCLPSDDTPRIQEMTILVAHIICDLVEKAVVKTAEIS
jgi:D-sedoheptulose 7-phosphate isomerase